MKHPITPDGRYFVVRGRLWRCTDPNLPEPERVRWVGELMAARRAVKAARAAKDDAALREARARVHEAKVALGERGPTWWEGDESYDRVMVQNSPYADWWAGLEP